MGLLHDPEVAERVERLELPFGPDGFDPWGVSKRDLVRWMSVLAWAYRHWFQVTTEGVAQIPARGRAMLVGNHSGGVAIDGAMVIASMLLEPEPPRLAQGMAEKFIAGLPFGSLIGRMGHLTGLPEHAERLLRDDRLLMVFPEGARGTAKLYWERDTLVDFGTGFMRLALATGAPIVPFAVVGGGEAFPTVMNLVKLGKLLGIPYLPVTAYLAPVPRRVPISIHYGEPIRFEGTGREEDEVIMERVEVVKQRVAALYADGARRRRSR